MSNVTVTGIDHASPTPIKLKQRQSTESSTLKRSKMTITDGKDLQEKFRNVLNGFEADMITKDQALSDLMDIGIGIADLCKDKIMQGNEKKKSFWQRIFS